MEDDKRSSAGTAGQLERTVRRYIESAVLWIPSEGVRGPNGLDATETIDLLCKRMVAALRDEPQTPTWQPINSAPKDGTAILGVWWSSIYAKHPPQAHVGICVWSGAWTPFDRALTHWMPLPSTSQLSRPNQP